MGQYERDSIKSAGGVNAMRHLSPEGKGALSDGGGGEHGGSALRRVWQAGGRPRRRRCSRDGWVHWRTPRRPAICLLCRRRSSLVLSLLARGVARATLEEELCYRQPN